MSRASYDTFNGLNAILESPRWPVDQACAAVERCLEVNRDNLRGFFEACFPTLLREVFGFDGSCWLAQAARPGREGEAASRALLRLLDPKRGPLLAAVRAVDAEGSVLFSFPVERLPGRTRLLLSTPTGRAALNASWPQYLGRLNDFASAAGGGGGGCAGDDATAAPNTNASSNTVVLLDAFGYYIHWVAYFATSAASSSPSLSAAAGTARAGSGSGDGGGSAATHLKPSSSAIRSTAARAFGAALGAAASGVSAAGQQLAGSSLGAAIASSLYSVSSLSSAAPCVSAAAGAPWFRFLFFSSPPNDGGNTGGCAPYQRLVADLLDCFLPHVGVATANAAAAAASAAGVVGGGGGGSGGLFGATTQQTPGGIFSLGGTTSGPFPGRNNPAAEPQQQTLLSSADASRGRVLASTLVEFWLSDCNEPEPAAVAAAAAAVAAAAARARRSGGGGVGGGGINSRVSTAAANAEADAYLASLGLFGSGFGGGVGGGLNDVADVATDDVDSIVPPRSLPGPPFAFPYEPPTDEVAACLATLSRHLSLEERRASGATKEQQQGTETTKLLPALALSPTTELPHPRPSSSVGVLASPAAPSRPGSASLASWLPQLPPALPALPRASGLPPAPPPPRLVGAAGSPAPQAYARSLYRFLRRALENDWPQAASGPPSSSPSSSLSARPLTPLVDVWLSFVAPWAPPSTSSLDSPAAATAALATSLSPHHQQQHRAHFSRRPLSAAAEGITSRLTAAAAAVVDDVGGGIAAGNSGSGRPPSASASAAAAAAAASHFFADLLDDVVVEDEEGGEKDDEEDDDERRRRQQLRESQRDQTGQLVQFSAADWAPHVLAFSPLWSGILPLFVECCCLRLRASAAAAEEAFAAALAEQGGYEGRAGGGRSGGDGGNEEAAARRKKKAADAARSFLLSPGSQHPPPSWILRDLVRVLKVLQKSRGLVPLLEATESAAAEAASSLAAAAAASSSAAVPSSAAAAAAARRHHHQPPSTSSSSLAAAFSAAGVLLVDFDFDASRSLGAFALDQSLEWEAAAAASPGRRAPVVPTPTALAPPPPPARQQQSFYYQRFSGPAADAPAAAAAAAAVAPSAFGDGEQGSAAARLRDAIAEAERASDAWSRVLPEGNEGFLSLLSSSCSRRSRSPPRQHESSNSLASPPSTSPSLLSKNVLSAAWERAAVRALKSAALGALPASYGAVAARERARRRAAEEGTGGAAGGLRRRGKFSDDDEATAAPDSAAVPTPPPPSPFPRRARPQDVSRYRGDWMLRPLGTNEVAWLARSLVRVSVAANSALGLSGETPSTTTTKPPSLGHPLLDSIRDRALKKRFRINLRPLAEKATLFWLPLLWLSLRITRGFLSIAWSVLTAPYEPAEWQLEHQQMRMQQMHE